MRAMRLVESIRNGLPPVHAEARRLAVGFDRIASAMGSLLSDVDAEGGRAMVIKGAYGQGKTFALKHLEEAALEGGFAVARTEIDATENRLNKPHHIYRDLLRHLRLPGSQPGLASVRALAVKTSGHVRAATADIGSEFERLEAGFDWLRKEIGCRPLAWLLSDPNLADKPDLLSLLMCDGGTTASWARRQHAIRGEARDWPVFNAGTQGDFASFLLSGLGRLSRAVGYKGLILILDEMEKWQDLNWKEQSQAGNLLGGLIWGATAQLGERTRKHKPPAITHSYRAGGFDFTTQKRNHVGVAIAMTPRGEQGPESLWLQYGIIEMVELPQVTERGVRDYCARLAPFYATAVALPAPQNGQLDPIANQAVAAWRRRGDLNTRSAVQAVIAALDDWRDKTASSI